MDQPHRVDIEDHHQLRAILELTRRSFAYMDELIDPPSSVHKLTVDSLISTGVEVWSIGTPPKASIVLTQRTDVLYVGKLAVAEHERGHGLARLLVEHAARRAGALKLGCIELQTRIELTENQRIFEGMGFVETERTSHPGFERPTSITYRRTVQGS